MTRLLNATPALILLALGIWLVLTGRPQAATIIIDARTGVHHVLCDGEAVAYEVEPSLTDSTGILVLPCHVSVHPDGGGWVGVGACGIEWGGVGK